MSEPEQDDLPCEKLPPPDDEETRRGVEQDHARAEDAD